MKPVSRGFWLTAALLSLAYVILGFFEDTNARLVNDAYDVFVVALPASALLFIAIYTILGVRGAAKWWQTDFGNRLVLFPLAIFVSSATLAWAQLFHGGLINTPLPAWIYLGGFIAATLVLLWGTRLWVRAFRDGDHDNPGGNPGP